MVDPRAIATRAGLTVLGEEGTAEEVRAAWRPFISGSAVPTVRVPESEDPDVLEAAWDEVVSTSGLISPSGEFLLSVSAPGAFDRPWLRVRRGDAFRVRDLGLHDDEPDFVATDVERRVAAAVSTEEDETWVLVAPG